MTLVDKFGRLTSAWFLLVCFGNGIAHGMREINDVHAKRRKLELIVMTMI